MNVAGKENIETIYPLAPMQQALLFHSLSVGKSELGFLQIRFTLRGALNTAAFHRAWQQVMEQHPVLRTSFHWEALEVPLQVVRRRVELPWQQQDFQGLSQGEQQQRLEAFCQADREQGFDLSQAPVMRLALIRMAAEVYECIWSFHHLILDGWSSFVLRKDVFALYEAVCRGQTLHLDCPRPYRDYIAWLRQQDLAEAETFWRQALKGFIAPTPLRVDRTPAPVPDQDKAYDEQHVHFSADATSDLQVWARQHQLSLNTLIQGAWAQLLSRYSGEADVVFGVTVAGRPATLPGVESMVGLFINTLPARVHVSPAATSLEWLQTLQAEQAEFRQYDYTSLVEIQEWSDIPGSLRLFESLFIFENYPVDDVLGERDSRLEICNYQGAITTNYPLTVVAELVPELTLQIIYDCRRFEAATIRRMLGHLQTLLESMVAHPESATATLPMLNPSEQELWTEWNHIRVDLIEPACFHRLFETRVEQTPEQVAIVGEGRQLSYPELNRRANQLAHYLRGLGVGPDVLVGIRVADGWERAVGLLGVLKAGGAYVPLDPASPQAHTAFVLEHSQVQILLTQERWANDLPAYRGTVVCLDTDWQSLAETHEDNPSGETTADNLAYVIYTSESEDQPQGVKITHYTLGNCLHAVGRQAGLTSQDIVLVGTGSSGDLAGLDLFLPLAMGARLVMASVLVTAHGTPLLERLADADATAMLATPAIWYNLLDAGWQGSPQLKMLCYGDALSRKLANELLPRGAALWNLYGAQETAIWSTMQQIEAGDGPISIGRPLANVQLYILDAHRQPVPTAIPGELYLRNPLTPISGACVPHLLSNDPEACLYKTGDLARYLPDGTIELLGRVDHEVQSRGFRIHPGEIETVLGQHPIVREAAVLAREDLLNDSPNNGRLVAYVVFDQAREAKTDELRSFLKAQLPDYLVPSDFVQLETLPRTPRGKVNRQLLATSDVTYIEVADTFVPPRAPLEFRLTKLWETVLGIQPIGVRDNFFDLGGQSLLALRLLAHIEKVVGKKLPLATLFQAPTVEQLSRILSQDTWEAPWSSLVAIQPTGSKPPFFCIHAAAGNVLFYSDLARYLGPNQPVYGLQAQGLDGQQTPLACVEEMATHYINEMRTLQPEGPYFLGGLSFGGTMAFEMAQQLTAQGQEVALLVLFDTYGPGYPEISYLRAIRSAGAYLGRRVRNNAARFKQLRSHDKGAFALEKVRNVTARSQRRNARRLDRFRESIAKVIYKIYRSLGRSLPPALRYLQVREANHEADRVYVAHPYSGRITLFRAGHQPWGCDPDPYLGWDKVALGGIEIYDIPGSHSQNLIREPKLQVVLDKLQACLSTAQATASGKQS